MVVQVDALEGVPSDEPHVVVVVDGEAREPPLVGMVARERAPGLGVAGAAADDAEQGCGARAGGGWWTA